MRELGWPRLGESVAARLCRLMCGKALPFRPAMFYIFGAVPNRI